MKSKPELLEHVHVIDCDGSKHVAYFDRTGIWWDKDTDEQLSPTDWWRLSKPSE